MRLEVVGDKALVFCNGVTISGRHEKFALPKTVLAIGAGNSPHEIRGLRLYEATRNAAWPTSDSPARTGATALPVTSPPALPETRNVQVEGARPRPAADGFTRCALEN